MALGERLASFLTRPQLIEFVGDLGGGKTTLVKGLAKGLGITGTVTSPSFNIHRSYQAPNTTGTVLEHFDLYRVGNDPMIEAELREAIENPQAIVVVEWAARSQAIKQYDRLIISLHFVDENSREITFAAIGPKSKKLLTKISHDFSYS